MHQKYRPRQFTDYRLYSVAFSHTFMCCKCLYNCAMTSRQAQTLWLRATVQPRLNRYNTLEHGMCTVTNKPICCAVYAEPEVPGEPKK